MPGIVKVKVIEGRNLPVMDRSADTTDAYVELKLGSITYKSDVYRKSLNPQWNTEWYRFEMADADLQDEPLQIRVMDYDTYSANDLIGKVYFNLNPLLLNSTSEIRNILKSSGHITSPGLGCISGWFPIYDTIYGLRGEINIIIKLELFSDFNKFRQSSCGVHIFCCSMIPHGYYTENIFGLVEELVVEDDPEYQWIEKIRSPRASNEARQAIFYKMSGVLQRKIGMKVVEMGGNAIIGYRQCFDLEGETGGVVVRGIGTAVKLNRYKKLETTVIRNSSPEIRRISLLNKSSKSELPEAENIVISQYGKETINSMDEFLSNPSNIDNSISESQVKCVSNVLNVDVKSTSQVDYSSKNCKFPCAPNRFNDYLYLNTNKTNCDVQITTADDNCNILSEALTPSRLLMHANNPDRNISEGEKEEELSKRENVKEGEHAIKNKSLSDTSSSVKGNERVKETSQEQDSVGSSYIIEYKGYNVIHKEHIELMEYPFFTLSNYPEHFIIHLGGTVSARSVKLLDRISNTEEPETRDTWWTELRIEIKSHMRALACNAVLNYMENTSICDEVCLLSASGTAALVKVYDGANSKQTDDTQKCMFNKNMDTEYENKIEKSTTEDASTMNCSIFHIPYRKSSLPFPVSIKVCEICKNGFVADVTFLTIEPLDKIPVIGQGAFIYAFVHRPKRDCRSELNAREISEGLPFLEYELNRQLINKLRIKGMNTLFGLNVHVSIGEKMIAAYATGTAMLLSALPVPPELSLMAHGKHFTQHPTSRKKLNEIRKLVEDMIKQNKIHYQLLEQQTICEILSKTSKQNANDDCTMQDQYSDMEYFAGSKQTCIIEVDDEDDLEIIAQLIDPNPPQGFFVSTTEKVSFGSFSYIPKRNIQLFAQVYRYRVPSSTPPSSFNKYFHRIVQALYMKIHHRIPCSLNKVSFKINIPEADELQIRIVGMALALKESEKALESVSTSCSSVSELADDFILNMDNEKDIEQGEIQNILTPMKHGSKKRNDIFDNEIHITSLSYIPGANINFYLGNLNFVFIRESTLVKEQPGGANNFVNNFLSDVTAVVKSHAAGIGGNAIVNFFLNECLLTTHSHKNQGQCLTHVGGDVVRYMYRNP